MFCQPYEGDVPSVSRRLSTESEVSLSASMFGQPVDIDLNLISGESSLANMPGYPRRSVPAALAYIGEIERARPVFEEALAALHGELPMSERLQLGRALARALGTAPLAYAAAGLEQLQKKLDVVTDSFNTNSHVCLSVLDFMESLVLGYVSDELAVDATTRRILDDDEYLVRRRIHRDLAQ